MDATSIKKATRATPLGHNTVASIKTDSLMTAYLKKAGSFSKLCLMAVKEKIHDVRP